MELRIIVALILILGAWGFGEYRYDLGVRAGKAAIQALWDQDTLKVQATAQAALAKSTQERNDALAANEVIQRDYQTQLSAANVTAQQLAARLRDAYTRFAASGGRLSEANTGSGPAAGGAAPSPASAARLPQLDADRERLTELLKAAIAESIANADALDALVAEVKPQQ